MSKKGEAERLFEHGYEAAKAVVPAMMTQPGLREEMGPMGFLVGKSDDFFIGWFFVADAHADIAELLDDEAPVVPDERTWWELRQAVASQEFQRRNCAVIGR